jgi:hypothetical protein
MEIIIDFGVMAKVEGIINMSEGRTGKDRLTFLPILNDRDNMSMDRMRVIIWQSLIVANPDVEFEDISKIYKDYVKSFVPYEKEEKATDRAGKPILDKEGNEITLVTTIGARTNLFNKIVEATDFFLGVPSRTRVKEKVPATASPMEDLSLEKVP